MKPFETPLLFLVFNRPDHTRKVFARIREIRPRFFFIAADGPRSSHSEDVDRCKLVREVITQGVDWPCEVKTLFRESNLGCGRGPAEAIDWFFENVEEGIILEDDCLPEESFFHFCSTLLQQYRHEPRVMHIGGNNYLHGTQRGDAAYYFSAFNHIWGWATWRRSWKNFNYSLTDFDSRELYKTLRRYGLSKNVYHYWEEILKKISDRTPDDVWDYQWTYSIWKHAGICITPNSNLVVNIGFGHEATHTKGNPIKWAVGDRSFGKDINHPREMKIDTVADHLTFNNFYHIRGPLTRRIKNRMLLNPLIRWTYDRLKNSGIWFDNASQ